MAIITIKYIEQIFFKKKQYTLGMKNDYMNNVFISRLYLHYKNTPKQKNTTKITITKTKKKFKKMKSLSILNGNTYLLIC
jgi:hypothetical protein